MEYRHKALFVLSTIAIVNICSCANILMITLGGTKSHKIPFWELARGLIPRGHNITFINAFPAEVFEDSLEEITPTGLVFYVRNYTDWDLIGPKLRGEESVPWKDVFRYGFEACEAFLEDPETKEFLHSSRSYDLLILDGAYPECALGIVHHFNAPFMYLNTVGMFTYPLSYSGSPTPYSVSPFVGRGLTDNMSLFQRALNTGYSMIASLMHSVLMRGVVNDILRTHFGPDVPHIYDIARNVSFVLQNGHFTLTYPRPYLSNVAEIACIHCKPAKPLPKDLENFISDGGDAGFIYVSMGSSVKEANMPEYLRRLFLRVFERLPYRVLWKWETPMYDLPDNIKVSRWLPQQDILGHPKIRAFVTHGGLLSMFETVYHGVPIVSMPVFCDHEANAAKAELDGYALKMDLQYITYEKLYYAISKVITDPKYKTAVQYRQYLLKDQRHTPLDTAIYWTEYVIKHRGAHHLQSPARDLGVIQYYLIDVIVIYIIMILILLALIKYLIKGFFRAMTGSVSIRLSGNKKIKTN